MFCITCLNPTEWACKCLTAICPKHVNDHIISCEDPIIEKFRESKLKKHPQVILLKRIKLIDEFSYSIMVTTKKIINIIEEKSNKKQKQLEKIKEMYIRASKFEDMQLALFLANIKLINRNLPEPNIKELKNYYTEDIFFGESKLYSLSTRRLSVEEINYREFDTVTDYFVSCGDDKTVRVWNLKTSSQEFCLEGHSNSVLCVAITKDNKSIISGSADKNIKIWSLKKKSIKRTIEAHSDIIRKIVISNNNKYFFSAGNDKVIKMWELKYESFKREFRGHTGNICCLAITSNDSFLVSGGKDKILKIWNIKKGLLEFELNGHKSKVYSIAFSKDDCFLYSCGKDKNIIAWDFQNRKFSYKLEGHKACINSLNVMENKKYIISGGDDTKAIIWDTYSKTKKLTFDIDSYIWNISATRDNKFIVSCGWGNKISLWDIKENVCANFFEGHTGNVRMLAFFQSL